jgi:predicted DNA-binding protein (MmcQ/YjbR family)
MARASLGIETWRKIEIITNKEDCFRENSSRQSFNAGLYLQKGCWIHWTAQEKMSAEQAYMHGSLQDSTSL